MSDTTVTYTNYEITVTAFGETYKHERAAQVGDMWKHNIKDKLVIISEVDDFYVKVYNTDDDGSFYDWHKSNFYTSFRKIE